MGGSECARVARALGISVRYTFMSSVARRRRMPFSRSGTASFFVLAGCFRLAGHSLSPWQAGRIDGGSDSVGGSNRCREDRVWIRSSFPGGLPDADYRGATARAQYRCAPGIGRHAADD